MKQRLLHILAAALVCLPVATSFAATPIKVSNETELRAAITTAMSQLGEQIIELTADITLSTNLTPISALESDVTFDLTIKSEEGAHYQIDGGGIHSIIQSNLQNNIMYGYNYLNCKITLKDMTLTGGAGTFSMGSNGGAIYLIGHKEITLENLVITNNKATINGGGIYIGNGAEVPTVTMNNVLVVDNSATQYDSFPMASVGKGGGIALMGGQGTLTNVTIASNTANGQVTMGGMPGMPGGTPTPGEAGALYIAATGNGYSLDRCIIWGNESKSGSIIGLTGTATAPTISNSIVQGGYTGEGISDFDPLFDEAYVPSAPGTENLGGRKTVSVASNAPTAHVTYADGSDATFDFSQNLEPQIGQAITITLSGEWTDKQLEGALIWDRVAFAPTIEKVDMSNATFSEYIDYGLSGAFFQCPQLKEVIFPQARQEELVYFDYTFVNCPQLAYITNLENMVTDGLYNSFGSLPALRYLKMHIDDLGDWEYNFNQINPNCLIYLTLADGVSTDDEWFTHWITENPALNFIIEGTSYANINLSYNGPFEVPTAFELEKNSVARYSRYPWEWTWADATTGTGWNTIVLPFDATLEADGTTKTQFKSDDSQVGDYWLKTFIGTENGDNGIVVKFAHEQAAGPRANTPYILALPGYTYGEKDLGLVMNLAFVSQKGITIPSTTIPAPVSNAVGYTFLGTYLPMSRTATYTLTSDANGEAFVWTEDAEADEAEALGAFQAYFTGPAPADAASSRLFIADENGQATSLAPANEETERQATRKLMTRNGLRISKAGKVYSIEGIEIE